jgi:4-hydroxybenzoate polyprenyltransferase
MRPYLHLARLDRPIGTWLLLFPCWWSILLATSNRPDMETAVFFALFAIGAVVMRAAGCTLNDIADRNFDAQVARTATRPIPSGAIGVRHAIGFLGLLLVLGLIILLQFNLFAIKVGILSLALVAIYPFMKRFTHWPQAVLGLAFNWGALLGWAAVRGDITAAPVALYAAGLLWTLGYDTIYAHQDKEDDLLVGVKSTALKLGDKTKPWLVFFYGGTIVLIGVTGNLVGLGIGFYAGLAVAAAHLGWQIATLDINDARNCLRLFKSNRNFGWIVLIAIIAGASW